MITDNKLLMKPTQQGLKNLKEFKNEWRLKCTDTWGDAMEAWFECTGWLYWLGEEIPLEWQYNPGASGNGCDSDSYCYELFKESSVPLLWEIAHLMARYCRYLRYKGMDY